MDDIDALLSAMENVTGTITDEIIGNYNKMKSEDVLKYFLVEIK